MHEVLRKRGVLAEWLFSWGGLEGGVSLSPHWILQNEHRKQLSWAIAGHGGVNWFHTEGGNAPVIAFAGQPRSPRLSRFLQFLWGTPRNITGWPRFMIV